MNNERTYRQLHPHVIDAQPSRLAQIRAGLVIGLALAASLLWWLLVLGFIFWPNTGPH